MATFALGSYDGPQVTVARKPKARINLTSDRRDRMILAVRTRLMEAMAEQGFSTEEIAEKTGLTVRRVQQCLKQWREAFGRKKTEPLQCAQACG